MDPFTRRIGFEVRTFRLQPWKLWLLVATGIALAVTLAIAMAGLLLILVPAVLISGLVARLLLGSGAARTPRKHEGPPVLEGRYEVVEPTARRRES